MDVPGSGAGKAVSTTDVDASEFTRISSFNIIYCTRFGSSLNDKWNGSPLAKTGGGIEQDDEGFIGWLWNESRDDDRELARDEATLPLRELFRKLLSTGDSRLPRNALELIRGVCSDPFSLPAADGGGGVDCTDRFRDKVTVRCEELSVP